MGTIYEIICWTTGRRYVGKTTQTLKERLQKHESAFRSRPENCYSRLILERGNYEIYELERVEDKSELNEREFYYIQHTDCVNHCVGKWLDEDFKKEYMKEYRKEYYEANKEVILERKKEYREANKEAISEKGKEKYTCGCGSILRKNNKKRHERDCKQHQNWLVTQP